MLFSYHKETPQLLWKNAISRDHLKLNNLMSRCEGAYASSTLFGYRPELNTFQQWCRSASQEWLPACASAVAGFVNAQILVCRPPTIRRRVSAIKFALRIANLPNPADQSEVRLALRRASRAKAQRPEQILELTQIVLVKIVELPQASLAELRDAALRNVGYDTLCRSAKRAALRAGIPSVVAGRRSGHSMRIGAV